MRGWLPLAVALAGCGRVGFGEQPDATSSSSQKPDAAAAGAGGPAADSPLGVGSYDVTVQELVPYVSPPGALEIPGFTADADDDTFDLPLPFTFTFYGIPYTAVHVSVNGYVTFGTPATGAETFANDCPFDSTPPDAMIAVFWDDLYAPTGAPAGTMVYAASGTAPDQRFVIEWRDLDAYYQAGGGNNSFSQGLRVTQQLVLHEDGTIELHYGPRTAPKDDRDCGLERHLGCSATVGLEAPGSTVFQPIQCGTAAGPGPGYVPLTAGHHLTFVPVP